jgi:hypothetical protein
MIQKDIKDITPKGSIIYKLLILLLSVALIATLAYPNSLWKLEAARKKQCRDNMEHILYAESVYLMEKNVYSPNLPKVVEFIKEDPSGRRMRKYLRSDSVLALHVIKLLKKDKLASSIIDSLQRYGRRFGIDTTEALVFDSLRTYPKFSQIIDSMAWQSLNNMFTCPTVKDSYSIEIVDTSIIKVLNVACPITKQDSLAIEKDFKLRRLGGLIISNHGKIKDWERSWVK